MLEGVTEWRFRLGWKHTSSVSLPRASLSLVLVLPAGSGSAPPVTAPWPSRPSAAGCAGGRAPSLRRLRLRGECAPRGAPAALTRSLAELGAAPPAGLHRPLLRPARAERREHSPLGAGPGARTPTGLGGECQGSSRVAPEGPDGRARCLGSFCQGPASLSPASPCPRCSGNPARAAGRRARPSRSTWPSWGAAERASPVSGAGARKGRG